MESIIYTSGENHRFDDVHSMRVIEFMIIELKKEGLSHDDILYSILSDDNIEGDRKRLTEFVERVLQNIIRAI